MANMYDRSGSLIVDYRVSWNENEVDKLSMDSMKTKLTDYLKDNNNYLSTYFVDSKSVDVNRVVDICTSNATSMG